MEQVIFCGLNSNSFGVSFGPASILEHPKNIKLWQNKFYIKHIEIFSSRKLRWVISYTLYRMVPQKHTTKMCFCTTISNIWKLHGPVSIREQQQNITLWQNRFDAKATDKSSSRKLRRVIYYTLYRMDPKKHILTKNKIYTHILKSGNCKKRPIHSP